MNGQGQFLVAWSRNAGSRKRSRTHLVDNTEALRTRCNVAIHPATWSIRLRQAGEPSCKRCAEYLRSLVEVR